MLQEIRGDFLQWLRGFYYVAKNRSVLLASTEMGRNQPAISHQIKCLERELGVILFDRSKGKMELTPEGKKVLKITISIFELILEMKSETHQRDTELIGEVAIAATHALILYYLPAFISNFREKNPLVSFQLQGGGVEMIVDKVESSEVDFGMACFESLPKNLYQQELFDTKLKLIAPRGHTYWPQGEITLELISKAPFIAFPPTSTISRLINRTFSENGLKLKVIQELNNFEIVKKYVEYGMGVSILDGYTLTEEDEGKFDIYALDKYFDTRVYSIILRKRKYLSPTALSFLHCVKPNFNLYFHL